MLNSKAGKRLKINNIIYIKS